MRRRNTVICYTESYAEREEETFLEPTTATPYKPKASKCVMNSAKATITTEMESEEATLKRVLQSQLMKVHKSERVHNAKKNCRAHEFRQHCYFCNEGKCLLKNIWFSHTAHHTGYYRYKCIDCQRKNSVPQHVRKGRNIVEIMQYPFFQQENIFGFLCDLCNYVLIDEREIEKHLKNENEGNVTTKLKKVVFMSFPKKEHISDEHVKESSDVRINSTRKRILRIRSMSLANLDNDIELPDRPLNKVPRLSAVHSEAFIAQTKGDDGLFDRNSMKNMSLSASADTESSSGSNRLKSIAETLSERFRSVEEDVEDVSTNKATETKPTDPVNRDKGITIVFKTLMDQDNTKPKSVETTNGKRFLFLITDY